MNGKFLGLAAASVMAFAFSAAPASADHVALLGNDLPHMTGKAEKLILHAHDTCSDQEFEGSNRNVIKLQASYTEAGGHGDPNGTKTNITKINDIFLLTGVEGVDDFTVLDGNACDNSSHDGALFTLPSDIATSWTAYFRLVGQPGTSFDIAHCKTVDNTTEVICAEAVVKTRMSGKPKTTDVTSNLLTPIDFDETNYWEAFTGGRAKATIYFCPSSYKLEQSRC
jgi:hypothetical protein